MVNKVGEKKKNTKSQNVKKNTKNQTISKMQKNSKKNICDFKYYINFATIYINVKEGWLGYYSNKARFFYVFFMLDI